LISAREQLEEIEFSSRLYEDGVFTISVPVTPHARHARTKPRRWACLHQGPLVTIRFAQLHTFSHHQAGAAPSQRPRHFHGIIEAVIDGADHARRG
jgi:hypothetical protein